MGKDAAGSGRAATWRLVRWVLWVIAAVAIVAVAVVGWKAVTIPRGLGFLETMAAVLKEPPDENERRIGQIILDNYKEYRTDARNWSAVYFGCLFFSAACAALAGLVIKLEFFVRNDALKKDLAAGLAMISALLITLSTVGGFHQRWWANRVAAAKMESLGYAFVAAGGRVDPDAFLLRLQAISDDRNKEIVSGESDRSKDTGTK